LAAFQRIETHAANVYKNTGIYFETKDCNLFPKLYF
jgi:hypothetical protein